jgi:broad specificity phosphatase PhoE
MKRLILLSILITLSVTQAINCFSQNSNNAVVFYLTRHGKTMLNTTDRVQGWSDSPLTPPGIEVAEYAGKGLTGINFKKVYSSDLSRARQTAQVMLAAKGDTNMEIITNSAFREVCCGSYEGATNDKMWGEIAIYLHMQRKDIYPKRDNVIAGFSAMKALDTIGMAEDYYDVGKRVIKALTEIAEETANEGGGNVLVVAHGTMLNMLLAHLDTTMDFPHMANACINKVEYKDGKFTILSVNDTSHIEKGKNMK